ncbi:LTA synthase family protein [Aquibacillus kalidii]|uniref:LTA synthase family protein n=1 Tax=Aquibacillus kalidii TaxID=2762597 RepID=UPI001646B681|nr:LTA synthase family protein [Aquibacillus kalidii]
MKKLRINELSFFLLAVVFLWAKTYISYQFEFNLGVEGPMQQFLLLINPISSAVVFLGLALFLKGRRAAITMILIDTIMTIVLYSNIVYYRFFDDFITVATLSQSGNIGEMKDGVLGILSGYDVLYFLDLLILVAVVIWKPSMAKISIKKWVAPIVVVSGIFLFFANLSLAEADRPDLLQRMFDRNYIVKYLGPFNYTIYDGIQTVQVQSEKLQATSDDLSMISNYTSSHYSKPNENLFGIAKGKNIIKIHLESFQTFLIDYKLNGEEVTPFINKLANGEGDMIYFDNFFHQTGQGKTADAELILDNSLFGTAEGAAFMTKGTNTFQSLPAILDQKLGYTSAVFHADNKTFWNRDQIYKQIGYNHFFDETYYDNSNSVNLGLKDKPFFEQSMPMLESLEQPFYAHMMTLTHHYPFNLDQEDATIDQATTGDTTVDRYFQTARYLDEAVEQFVNDLKASGLYENSVIMLYGDHNGISENHNRAMKEILGTEITPYQNAQNQRVPLMLHIPGVEGGVNHTFGGEIDVMPTLLHLQGIDNRELINFGTDLFSKTHDQTVAFRNGDLVSPEYTIVGDTVYDTATGEELESTEETDKLKSEVIQLLKLSDEVMNKDLLRFNDLADFEPVDPSDYKYGDTVKDTE